MLLFGACTIGITRCCVLAKGSNANVLQALCVGVND